MKMSGRLLNVVLFISVLSCLRQEDNAAASILRLKDILSTCAAQTWRGCSVSNLYWPWPEGSFWPANSLPLRRHQHQAANSRLSACYEPTIYNLNGSVLSTSTSEEPRNKRVDQSKIWRHSDFLAMTFIGQRRFAVHKGYKLSSLSCMGLRGGNSRDDGGEDEFPISKLVLARRRRNQQRRRKLAEAKRVFKQQQMQEELQRSLALLQNGDRVLANFKVKGGARSRTAKDCLVANISAVEGTIKIVLPSGVQQVVPFTWVESIINTSAVSSNNVSSHGSKLQSRIEVNGTEVNGSFINRRKSAAMNISKNTSSVRRRKKRQRRREQLKRKQQERKAAQEAAAAEALAREKAEAEQEIAKKAERQTRRKQEELQELTKGGMGGSDNYEKMKDIYEQMHQRGFLAPLPKRRKKSPKHGGHDEDATDPAALDSDADGAGGSTGMSGASGRDSSGEPAAVGLAGSSADSAHSRSWDSDEDEMSGDGAGGDVRDDGSAAGAAEGDSEQDETSEASTGRIVRTKHLPF